VVVTTLPLPVLAIPNPRVFASVWWGISPVTEVKEMSTMSETDPDHQYTGDGERENPEAQEGRIDQDEGTAEEEDQPRPNDDDR
jgi:hypothetical protein